MGEVLGLGISHYPLLGARDSMMSVVLENTLLDPDIPAEVKNPSTWPAEMREEWGSDRGLTAATEHRRRMLHGLRQARVALDNFAPDFVIIWGDDQYENFKEDIIPPFCIAAYDDMTVQPWLQSKDSAVVKGRDNVWDEPADASFVIRGAREQAKFLTSALIRSGFDISYAYKPLHHPGLPHAFLNSTLYLDYDRKGFPYPVIPFQVNCYGERVIAFKGFTSLFGEKGRPLDPIAPTPARCFNLGAEVAKICRDSPWRVALIASSSWSHAFLTDKTWRLRPDVEFDRQLHSALMTNDYEFWRNISAEKILDSGEQELLSWFALIGAMNELGQSCSWSDFVETYIFNSSKVTAVFDPVPQVTPVTAREPHTALLDNRLSIA